MEKFQNTLGKIGLWTSENKYLSAIKTAFENFMPFVIIGAVAVLWSNVIVNDTTGLGALLPPVMKLSFLNPAFNAINFATMGTMGLALCFLVGCEMAKIYDLNVNFCGVISIASLVSVTNTVGTLEGAEGTLSGLFANELGTNGLFTGMIMGIVSIELFRMLYKVDKLKIKLPPAVPSGIARSFEYMVPGFIVLVITSLISLVCNSVSGLYLNDVIFTLVQKPLMNVGGFLPGVLTLIFVSTLFWTVGLHGDNMTAAIVQPLTLSLLAENTAAVSAGQAPTNIVNFPFYRCFLATGGTGIIIALTIAIFLVGKRDDNRSLAKLAIVPNLFNINEINMFGLPVVLNPYLLIPFILCPLVATTFGYVMTVIGICPVMYINVPWTMPPFLLGFLASGGNIMGGVVQLMAVAICVVIYIPFVKMYEASQNKLDELNQENMDDEDDDF